MRDVTCATMHWSSFPCRARSEGRWPACRRLAWAMKGSAIRRADQAHPRGRGQALLHVHTALQVNPCSSHSVSQSAVAATVAGMTGAHAKRARIHCNRGSRALVQRDRSREKASIYLKLTAQRARGAQVACADAARPAARATRPACYSVTQPPRQQAQVEARWRTARICARFVLRFQHSSALRASRLARAARLWRPAVAACSRSSSQCEAMRNAGAFA